MITEKSMFKVSIIVPVYNAQKYINKCIESIISQTYSGIELIIVDDGSTDGSGRECDILSAKDDRITVIHQKNSGVTAARFTGLSVSSGNYIAFVDSDDWIDPGYIENAVVAFQNIPQLDIVAEGMVFDYPSGISQRRGMAGIDCTLDQFEAVSEMFHGTFYFWELCGKVYRKDLFRNYTPDESITIGEDLDCNWVLFNKARFVHYTCKSSYHYFQNESSAMHEQDYIKDTQLMVFDRILNSEYRIPYFGRVYLLRYELLVIARTLRAMLMDSPSEFKERISELSSRLQSLFSMFPDAIPGKQTLIELLSSDNDEQIQVFTNEKNKIRSIIENTSGTEKYYIFGTGAIAEAILFYLKKEKIQNIGFAVSDSKYDKKSFKGYDVKKISDITPISDNVFILSVRKTIRSEIKEMLKILGHNNVLCPELDPDLYGELNL